MHSLGRLILMGSGELAPPMVPVHRLGIERAEAKEVVVLDSPFSFQENAPQLTSRIADFFETSLSIGTGIAAYRKPSDGPARGQLAVSAVNGARYVFAGPGSPSYALDRWREIELAPALVSVIERGGTVTMASAAALTAGRHTIPVYEIYKVGADPFWLDGLDLSAAFGLSLVVVPHFNNREGGDHDTSHCYIGGNRFSSLEDRISDTVVGIDEHSALVIDFGRRTLEAFGVGSVTIRDEGEFRLESGDSAPMSDLESIGGRHPYETPAVRPIPPTIESAIAAGDVEGLLNALLELPGTDHHDALRAVLVETAAAAGRGMHDHKQIIEGFVELALDLRTRARGSGDYELSDEIRDRLVGLGVEVNDTRDGTDWDLPNL